MNDGYHRLILTRLTRNGKESPDNYWFTIDRKKCSYANQFLNELRYKDVGLIKILLEELRFKPTFITVDENGITTDRTKEVIPQIIQKLDNELGLHQKPKRCTTPATINAALNHLKELGCTIPK